MPDGRGAVVPAAVVGWEGDPWGDDSISDPSLTGTGSVIRSL